MQLWSKYGVKVHIIDVFLSSLSYGESLIWEKYDAILMSINFVTIYGKEGVLLFSLKMGMIRNLLGLQ